MAMAALPRIVTALKGSSRFLAARWAFSLGVSGLTSGPFMNRLKKLMMVGGAQGGSCFTLMLSMGVPGAGGARGGKTSWEGMPAAVARKLEPVADRVLPADSLLGTTRHGPAFEFSCLMTGNGASGSGAAGLAGGAWPKIRGTNGSSIRPRATSRSNKEVRFGAG